ncbi:hypothetical protein F9K79_22300 [Ochrobactrum sp. Kaboul]|uniref:hypothetical protein n=1 Tax=Brucella tritici TaxID=94626 RepID=UPI000DD4FE49|nr:hypothetical protein [Brucella tritici]KAB2692764.1 hypothetical protein F9K79_22300 [Ochrobactrum sp. Kaboul]
MTHRLQKNKFERLAVLHRPDCAALDLMAPAATADEDALPDLQRDESINYAMEVRPIYEVLRRVVGQIAGLLILAQITRRHEVLELPELAACEARCSEASERLKALSASAGAGAHFRVLDTSHKLCRAILDSFPQWRRSPDPDAEFGLMEERLRAAYRYLTAGSWEKGGLSMVDFRNACCSCEAGKLTS